MTPLLTHSRRQYHSTIERSIKKRRYAFTRQQCLANGNAADGKADNVFNQRYYQNGWLAARATLLLGSAMDSDR